MTRCYEGALLTGLGGGGVARPCLPLAELLFLGDMFVFCCQGSEG